MPISRRRFLKSSTAAASLAALHPHTFLAPADLQQKLAADPLRPQFHLLPAKNWMNDPNGPIFWRGKYHMFFQYNPDSPVWGDMHWNHAVSDDMIRWRHLPIALAPTPNEDDADGCFTGSAVNDNGTPTIIYTGVKSVPANRATLRDGQHSFRETQLLATSKDPSLLTWQKFPKPVIEPPQDPALTGFRDPFLFKVPTAATRESNASPWYCGVASGQFKKGGRVLLYQSQNLRDWKYLHALAEGQWSGREHTDPVGSGEMWECPDFFPLDKKWVLLYSTAGGVFWEVGELDPKELVFHSQTRGILDHGAYYAQKTQLDAKGNRILWGWIPEKRPDSELIAAGWAGCMALPRVLSIGDDGSLDMRFLEALHKLSNPTETWKAQTVSNDPHPMGIMRLFERAGISKLAGYLGWRTNGFPCTVKLHDQTGSWLTVGLEQNGHSSAKLTINEITADIEIDGSKPLDFQLFLDASVAELICNSRHAFTARIYRKPAGNLQLSVGAEDQRHIESFSVSQLEPISSDRLTT
jgi:beta-fructofuranosidase